MKKRTLAIAALGGAAAVLSASGAAYWFGFHSPNRTQNLDHSLAKSKQMDPLRDRIIGMIDDLNDLAYERVSITSRDGLRLAGRYYRGNDGAPLAICCHGWRGTPSRDFSGGAMILIRHGYNVLLIEERAQCSSEGHTITYGVKERYDVLDWTRWAVERFGAELRIVLIGISMGAATVLMTAEMELPENVRGIIADCPYTAPMEIIKKVGRDVRFPNWVTVPLATIAAGVYGHFSLRGADAREAVKHTKVPILLIHGEADDFVPCEMSAEIYAANPAMIQRHTFPDAGHGLSYLLDTERYEKLTVDFIEHVTN